MGQNSDLSLGEVKFLTTLNYFTVKLILKRKKKGKKGLPGGSVVRICLRCRRPPEMQMWFWSLGKEDPLEKEIATHSSIIAWKIPWTEESGRLQSMQLQKSDTT